MLVDVTTSIDIARPRDVVAAFAADPTNVRKWYTNIDSVEWVTAPQVVVGARVAFVARFLGRELRYVYSIVEFIPGERLVMATQQGPFPMETTYEWHDRDSGGTTMSLRNRGRPRGFSIVIGPLMARAIRRANRKDLVALKGLLEA